VYAFGTSGFAVRVTEVATHLSGAGFEPEVRDGPYLALSTDASLAAWRVEGPEREVFAGPVKVATPKPGKHLTGDNLFTDTLDDSGVIGFLGPKLLIAMIGEGAGFQGVENADMYEFDLDAGGTPSTVVNLSATTGNTTTPFEGGILTTSGDLFRIPGYFGLFGFNEESGGAGRLLAVPFDGSPIRVLMNDVKNIREVELTGDYVALVAERDNRNRFDVMSVHSSMANAPRIIASLPDRYRFSRSTSHDHTNQYAFVIRDPLRNEEFLVRTHAPSGVSHVLHQAGVTFGPSLIFTPGGSMGTTLVLPNRNFFVAWDLDQSVTLFQGTPVGSGQFLPGL